LYTVFEIASLLDISRIAVYKKIKQGKIKAEKIGRRIFVSKKEVENLNIGGLSDKKKQKIDKVVNKAMEEFGETFKLLGKE